MYFIRLPARDDSSILAQPLSGDLLTSGLSSPIDIVRLADLAVQGRVLRRRCVLGLGWRYPVCLKADRPPGARRGWSIRSGGLGASALLLASCAIRLRPCRVACLNRDFTARLPVLTGQSASRK